MKIGVVGFLGLFGAVGLCDCSHVAAAPPPMTSPADSDPHWEGALQPLPELLLLVRPQALRRDPLYGPLVGRVIELARDHTPIVAASGALEAMENAEEVIVGLRESRTDDQGDLLVVIRGVPASADPAHIVDDSGQALWSPSPNGATNGVRELLRNPAEAPGQGAPSAPDASLFELPSRTWVIATGGARARSRDAFARPVAVESGPLGVPSGAIAALRLNGPSLVSRVRALRPPGPLAALGSNLSTATVVLLPGEDALVRATLVYKDEQAVMLAQSALRAALDAVARAKPDDYAWLRSVTLEPSRCCIVVSSPLPKQIFDDRGSPVGPTPSSGDRASKDRSQGRSRRGGDE